MTSSNRTSLSRIGLGTAQMGMLYGITNCRGRIPQDEVRSIFDDAERAGVHTIDCASAYGDAEKILGAELRPNHPFRIVTKLLPVTDAAVTEKAVGKCAAAFAASLSALRTERIHGLLVHHGRDLTLPGSERLIDLLMRLRSEKRVRKIGVSVYSPEELEMVADRFVPDIAQIPVNIADQRFVGSRIVAQLRAAGTEIHARSLFLQGILLAEPSDLPGYFSTFASQLARIGEAIERARMSRLEACISFGLHCPEIDVMILGVHSRENFREILSAAGRAAENAVDASSCAVEDLALVHPSRWQV